MNCGCQNYVCHNVYLIPCSGSIALPLLADETGTWIMITEFNGITYRTDINVTDGQPIVIPTSALNEKYRHPIRFIRSDGSLFNNTCYSLNVMATIFTNPAPQQTTQTVSFPFKAISGGMVFQHNDLIGVIMHDVITINNASYQAQEMGITHDPATGEVDFTVIGGYMADDTITFLVEKPV